MANYRKQQDRLPKHEYFALRLEQAIKDGLTDKADYYRSRLAQLEEAKESEDRMSLPVQGMFGSRKNLEEALKYAQMMAQSMESPIHALTPVYVLYNTIAENYDLVPKAK